MQRALKILIIAGLVVWGFIMLEQYVPNYVPSVRITDANTDPKCQKFGKEGEGEHTLGYGDRVKQIFAGCW
jgi:hypothetical protein